MLFIKLWLYLDFDLNVWCEGIYWYIIFSQLDLDHNLNLDLYLDFDLLLKAFIELIFAQLELNLIPDLDLSFDLYVKVYNLYCACDLNLGDQFSDLDVKAFINILFSQFKLAAETAATASARPLYKGFDWNLMAEILILQYHW